MSDDAWSFWLGVFCCGFVFWAAFQFIESECQAQHNVADCEWSRSPFTPVIGGTENE